MRWAVLTMAAVVGCSAAPHVEPSARLSADERLERYTRAFRTAEPVLLGTLAVADPRVAHRFSDAPSLGGRYADPFLFDQRARTLSNVFMDAQRCAVPADVLPETARGEAQRVEQELLFRMIAEEFARLDRERVLPGGAADLVRATVISWPTLQSAREQRVTESLVAWRLDQVRLSLAPNALSALDREDLVDALEELRGAVDRAPAPHAETALHRLRQDVDTLGVAPLEVGTWNDLAQQLRAHHGIDPSEEELRDGFLETLRTLGAQVDVAFRVLGPEAALEMRRAAADRLAHAPECRIAPRLQGMRALAPPPERVWACAAVHAAAARETEADEITTLVVLHDVTTLGLWALELHGEHRDPTSLRERHPLMSLLDADRASRLLREAATHPVGPLGGALAVELLVGGGPARISRRARAWTSFGDAPLDIVRLSLFIETAL